MFPVCWFWWVTREQSLTLFRLIHSLHAHDCTEAQGNEEEGKSRVSVSCCKIWG
jgi:hypothetical protein